MGGSKRTLGGSRRGFGMGGAMSVAAKAGLNRQFKVPTLKHLDPQPDPPPHPRSPSTMPSGSRVADDRAVSPIDLSSSDDDTEEPRVANISAPKDSTSEMDLAPHQTSTKQMPSGPVRNLLGVKNREVFYPAGPVKVKMQEDPVPDGEVDDLEVVIEKNRITAQEKRRSGTLEDASHAFAAIGSVLC